MRKVKGFVSWKTKSHCRPSLAHFLDKPWWWSTPCTSPADVGWIPLTKHHDNRDVYKILQDVLYHAWSIVEVPYCHIAFSFCSFDLFCGWYLHLSSSASFGSTKLRAIHTNYAQPDLSISAVEAPCPWGFVSMEPSLAAMRASTSIRAGTFSCLTICT